MPHTGNHTLLDSTLRLYRHGKVTHSHSLNNAVVREMYVHRRNLLVVRHVLFRVCPVLRRPRVDQPIITRLGGTPTNRKRILARFVLDLSDACSLRVLPLRIFANSHRTLGDPMPLFNTVVVSAALLCLPHSFALAVVTCHEHLAMCGSIDDATLLLALRVLV